MSFLRGNRGLIVFGYQRAPWNVFAKGPLMVWSLWRIEGVVFVDDRGNLGYLIIG